MVQYQQKRQRKESLFSPSASPKKIHWIQNLQETATACAHIVRYKYISLDMEGLNLCERHGVTSLVQIGVSGSEVYVFDALALGRALFCTEENAPLHLGIILTDARIVKLCYDCRADARALHLRHSILPCGLYDLQIVYTLLYQSYTDPFLKGMHKAMQQACVSQQEVNLKMNTKKMGCDLIHRFFERPLACSIMQYCALDAACLFQMYAKWAEFVDDKVVLEMTDERIRKFMYDSSEKRRIPLTMSKIDFYNKKSRLSKWP